MNLGPTELIIVLVIVLLLFGSTKLPKLARSLGQAQREFKQGTTEAEREEREEQARASETKAEPHRNGTERSEAQKDSPAS